MSNITELRRVAAISFYYTNHRGERALRNVTYLQTEFGANEFYPEPTIFLRCYDDAKQAERSFDVKRIEDLQRGWRT